jgi:pilus assembly protein CpaB
MSGEPLTTTKIVHADAAGFLAAQLMPGMRAISIPISVDTSAGGFILPNDRVDILSTQQIGDAHHYRTSTILSDVRVLAVDQTYETKDSKAVVGRTATLELSPDQVEMVERARAGTTLSLALRALGDSNASANANTASATKHKAAETTSNEVAVIRYSIERPSVVATRE